MNEATRNFLVGLFVLAALATLGILMVWFGETPSWLQTSEWTLEIVGVKEIRGIGEGSPVLMGGVEIGRVNRLGFRDPDRPALGVVVFARIKNKYQVPQGSIARMYGSMLGIGTGQINIIVPEDERLPVTREGQAQIIGETGSLIGEIITPDFMDSFRRAVENLANLADAATPLAQNLAELMESRSPDVVGTTEEDGQVALANLSTVLQRFDEFLNSTNEVVGDKQFQEHVKGLAGDLRDSSEELRKLLRLWQDETTRLATNANESLDQTRQRLEELLGKMILAADKLDRTAGELYAVAHAIAEGEGTAGLLVRDPRLYEAAVLSLERIGELAARLNRITGKIERDGYITIGQVTPVGTFTRKFPIRQAAQPEP